MPQLSTRLDGARCTVSVRGTFRRTGASLWAAVGGGAPTGSLQQAWSPCVACLRARRGGVTHPWLPRFRGGRGRSALHAARTSSRRLRSFPQAHFLIRSSNSFYLLSLKFFGWGPRRALLSTSTALFSRHASSTTCCAQYTQNHTSQPLVIYLA